MANKKITDYTEILAAGVDDFLDISVDLGGGVYDTRKIKASNIGGASPLTTKGDLFTYDTADARLPIGTDGQALIADSAEATGLRWGTVSADNMATADLTLTGDRTHDLNGNVLKFDNGQVTIEGVSTSSSQFSLIVQNSSAIQLLKIDDSGGFALGLNATTFGYQSVTIGNGTSTTADLSVAIGNGASSTSQGAISIGHLALANGSSNSPSISIGQQSDAAGFRSVALGYIANASGTQGVSIGTSSVASGTNCIAINGTATNNYSISLMGSTTGASQCIAIGRNSVSSLTNAVAIGADSQANGYGSVCLGYGARSSANYAYIVRSGLSGSRTNSTTDSMEVHFSQADATFRFGQSVDGWLNTTGSFGFGTITPSASAVVDLSSTTKGFLPPRMTTTEKNAISSPTAGLVVFDSTLAKLCIYTGSAWETITSA